MELYKIQSHIAEVLERGFSINEETGEYFGTEELEALKLAEEAKLEATACFIKNTRSDVEALRAEEKALAERRKTEQGRIDRAMDYLSSCMQASGKTNFKSARCVVGFRQSSAVDIDEGKFFGVYGVGSDFVRTKHEPNKTAITQALKEGKTVFGAVLQEKMNLGVK